jgi:hypothetical protein
MESSVLVVGRELLLLLPSSSFLSDLGSDSSQL